MAKQMMPNTGRDLIVSFNYDPTGLAWVECFDNAPLGWAVDDVDITHPEPVVVGSLPPAAPATAPVLSPQWAQYTGGYLVVPDVVRLLPGDFFTWLGTNNGATREVRSSMKSADLNQAFHQWSGGAPSAGSFVASESAPPVEGAFAPGAKVDGERRGGPVDPMRSSDLGDEHRGNDKAPGGKHRSHGADEHRSSR